jgi:hypothetical protein
VLCRDSETSTALFGFILLFLRTPPLRGFEWYGDSATVDSPTSGVLRKSFRVLAAAANDAPGLEGKYAFNELLHSFQVHYPICFPRFSTVG